MLADPAVLVATEAASVRFGRRTVLDSVDIAIAEGEIVSLIGPNGAGKSTLAKLLLGLIPPTGGRIYRRPGIRVGYLPQRLAMDRTLPFTVRRFTTLTRRASAAQVEAALREVGAEALADAEVSELSGGELQRVLLARSLLQDPQLLVLDEPTQGVDYNGEAALYDLIRRIRDRRGCGVLTISHVLHLVMAATDRVVCLNGHVCCAGRPDAVTRDPQYRALFGEHAPAALAVYAHDHDHTHDISGAVVDGGTGIAGPEQLRKAHT